MTKNWINLDLIKIFQVFLKICNLWMDIWVGEWVGSYQINKNRINLELNEIFRFCVKVYDLWRLCHLHTYPSSGVRYLQLKFWVSSIVQMFDFLTIDVLCITASIGHSFDILTFDFLLKPPQPTTELFYLSSLSILFLSYLTIFHNSNSKIVQSHFTHHIISQLIQIEIRSLSS